MHIKQADKKYHQTQTQLNVVALVASLLLISNLILSYWVGYAYQHQRTLIVPFNLKQASMISNQSVDAHYLEEIGLGLVQYRYTVSPDTVHDQFQTLLHHTDPRFYSAFKKTLLREEADIQKEKFSEVLYIQSVKPDARHLTLEVKGLVKRYVGELTLPERKMQYVLKFTLQNQRLWLTHITAEEIRR